MNENGLLYTEYTAGLMGNVGAAVQVSGGQVRGNGGKMGNCRAASEMTELL